MGWSINAKTISIPEGAVKKIVSGGVTLWQKANIVYTPILPDDTTTYPMYRNSAILEFAVTDGANFGYYAPSIQTFTKENGLTGTVIERVEYVEFDGQDCYVNTGVNLTGADTVTMDFLYNKSGSNIFGSWRSSNTNVYTLYASASKSYIRYGSGLYRGASIPINTRLTYQMTPTGNYVDGVAADTWAQADFDSATPCLVGWLNGSGSPHMGGNVYDFSIDNKSHLIPVKIGTTYYLFDCLRWRLPNHAGKFGGGLVTDEPIEFPTLIPEESPPMLMMGRPPIPQPEPEPGPETDPEFEEDE